MRKKSQPTAYFDLSPEEVDLRIETYWHSLNSAVFTQSLTDVFKCSFALKALYERKKKFDIIM